MSQVDRLKGILEPLATHPDGDVRDRVGRALEVLKARADCLDLIPPRGSYRDLASYAVSEIVYDATMVFCDRFVDRRSRTHDQMVQAARSGKQNIAEGSMASGTSKKTELKLVNVARASLEELRVDYEDFLRTRGLPLWSKTDPKAREVRSLARCADRSFKTYEDRVRRGSPENAANTVICLVHQACFLLDRQLRALQRSFLEEGGFTERLYRSRRAYRQGG